MHKNDDDETVNREGLTFQEWARAAGIKNFHFVHVAAWNRGEDPTDWRAEKQH